MVTAAAFDAARVVAGSDGGPEAEAAAERRARELLDGYDAEDLAFDWRYTTDSVELHVVATHPTALLPRLDLPFQRVDRTIRVRLERLR